MEIQKARLRITRRFQLFCGAGGLSRVLITAGSRAPAAALEFMIFINSFRLHMDRVGHRTNKPDHRLGQ
jgi:hypothetical protein